MLVSLVIHGCLVFLLVPMVPNLGTAWMNWSVAAAAGVGLLVLLPFDERYRRLEVDERGRASPPPSGGKEHSDAGAPLLAVGDDT